MQWEYCVTRIDTEDQVHAQNRLDGLGADGWELVWLTPAPPTVAAPESKFTLQAIFKRPKDNDNQDSSFDEKTSS